MSDETASESPGFPPYLEAHARMTAGFWRAVATHDGSGELTIVWLRSYRPVAERHGIHPSDALIAALERVLGEAMGAARARTRVSFDLWAAYYGGAVVAAKQALATLHRLVAAQPTVAFDDLRLPFDVATTVIERGTGELAEAFYARARDTAAAAFADATIVPGLTAPWDWMTAQTSEA